VVPGNPFFPGLQEDWPHTRQCLRLSLTASAEDLVAATHHLAEVVNQLYQGQAQPAAALATSV
jgi:valine--pyruvate aminotransferase